MKKTIIKLLKELKTYILIWMSILFFLICFCFYYKNTIYSLITAPLLKNNIIEPTNISMFIYTSIFESFATDLITSIYSALYLSTPIAYILVYKFIAKSLYKKEKRIVGPIFLISFFLLNTAIVLNYKVLFPRIVTFFLSVNTIATPMLKISDYASTFFHLTITFCLILQFPIILIILKKFGLVNNDLLTKNRKIAIVIIFIISAIITPPDVLSQIVLSIFLIIIYEITNLIVRKL